MIRKMTHVSLARDSWRLKKSAVTKAVGIMNINEICLPCLHYVHHLPVGFRQV